MDPISTTIIGVVFVGSFATSSSAFLHADRLRDQPNRRQEVTGIACGLAIIAAVAFGLLVFA